MIFLFYIIMFIEVLFFAFYIFWVNRKLKKLDYLFYAFLIKVMFNVSILIIKSI